MNAAQKEPVQHGKQTWAIQWLPPGKYTVQVHATQWLAWETLAEQIVVEQGKISEVPMKTLPPAEAAPSGKGGAGVKR